MNKKYYIAALSIILSFSFVIAPFAAHAEIASAVRQNLEGTISSVDVCCNGLKLQIDKGQYTSPISGSMIFMWQNMIPIPFIGWGLYSWWDVAPQSVVLGDAISGGTCITVDSECESTESVQYSIQQLGTTLYTSK